MNFETCGLLKYYLFLPFCVATGHNKPLQATSENFLACFFFFFDSLYEIIIVSRAVTSRAHQLAGDH